MAEMERAQNQVTDLSVEKEQKQAVEMGLAKEEEVVRERVEGQEREVHLLVQSVRKKDFAIQVLR